MAVFIPASIDAEQTNVGEVPPVRRLRVTLEANKVKFHKSGKGNDSIAITWEITSPASTKVKDPATGELTEYAIAGQKLDSYHGWSDKSAAGFLAFLNQMGLDPSNPIDTDDNNTLEPFKGLAMSAYVSSSQQPKQEWNPDTGEIDVQKDEFGKMVLGKHRWNLLNGSDIIERVPRSTVYRD